VVIFYIFLLALQVLSLILAIRRKTKRYWISLFFLEAVSAVLAWRLGVWFDSLPGYGFMPGLTYISETLFGYGTAVISLGIAALSAILWIVLKKKN
jgi:hypothetical protein